MRPEVVADENFRAEKQRTHMQVIAPNPALGARALQDLLAAERVVAAAIAADLGVDQTHLQPQVAAAAAVNALRGASWPGSWLAPAATLSRPSTRRLTCWNTASAPSAPPPATIPAPRPPKPLRATPDQATRLRNPVRADMPRHQTTPSHGIGPPGRPLGRRLASAHGTSIRSVPRGQPDASGG